MWDIENQDIIVLVSVISVGCAIILNVWGSFIALTPILVLIVLIIIIIIIFGSWCTYNTYHNDHHHRHQHSTTTDNDNDNDTLFITPHVYFLALDYLKQAGRELNAFLENFYNQIFRYSLVIGDRIYNLYKKHIVERMAAQRRRNTYQLSTEHTTYSTINPKNSMRRLNFVDAGQLSPIPRLVTSTSSHEDAGSDCRDFNNVTQYSRTSTDLRETDSRIWEGHQQVTSTPLISSSSSSLALRRADNATNGHTGFHLSGMNSNSWKSCHSALLQNHTSPQGDDVTYNLTEQSSPWGTSISPKMRARAGGIKTVQTVAGPLLASTRYNIDPKVYSDVTSPGLTTRLTKYATEANMKLTHQSQYGTGQFPRVNLSSSPTPLINMKMGKMRMPVKVRVAPPESTRYSPPERQQILSDIFHVESKRGLSVVQVLREISLKRHASREDVTFDLAKKQRTEGLFTDGLENLEEMTQKRGRDDSSRSEEDSSPPNNKVFGRPAKRSKMPSCCYDILSSLSSSINVTSGGLKRKAIDLSPNGASDDVGKHFKSLDFSDECADGIAITRISRGLSEPTKDINTRVFNEAEKLKNSNLQSHEGNKSLDSTSEKIVLKSKMPGKEFLNDASGDNGSEKNCEMLPREDGIRVREKISKFSSMPDMKFTEKLFMKAEPQNIDKLKSLIEEHGSIKPQFTTNDTDEIKKSDIVNMRQTSMKTRLKSMFDAISGKATSQINPEVVIQADESTKPASELTIASLNSSTWTTNVNTSPIATSAIVPIIGKAKLTTTPAKHVTFQFNNAKTASEKSPEIVESQTIDTTIIDAKTTNSRNIAQETKKIDNPKMEKSTVNSILEPSNPPSANTIDSFGTAFTTSSEQPAFFIASSTSFPITSTSNHLTIPVSSCALAKTTISPNYPESLVMKTTASSPLQFNSTQMSKLNSPTTSSSLFGISTATTEKSISNPLPSLDSTSQSSKKNFQSSVVNFSFGTSAITRSSPPKSQESQSSSSLETNRISTTCALPMATTSAMTKSGLFGLAAASKPVYTYPGALNTSVSTPFSFGGNATTPQTTDKKAFTFGPMATVPSTKAPETAPIISGTPATSQQAAMTTGASGFNFSTCNNATPTTTTSNLFGAPIVSTSSFAFAPSTSTTPAFTFGSNLTTTAASSKPGFYSSVTSPTTAASVAASTPTTNTVSTFSFATTSNNVAIPIFGTPSTTSSSTVASTDGSSNNNSNNNNNNSSNSNNTQSIFGASTTSTTGFATSVVNSLAFITTSGQSATSTFGSNSTNANTFGTPKTIETPVFGGTNTGGSVGSFAVNSTTSSGLFSRANTDAITTNSIGAFGSNNFGQTKTAPPAFGANASSSFPSVASTNLFGTQSTETAGTFGTSVNPGASSSATPNFGSSSGTRAAPSFGISNTPVPSFGASSTTTVATFGTPSTAPPPFGATNTSSSSSTPATATGAFGGQSLVAAGTIVNTNATGSTFGAASTAPPAFPASLTPQFGISGSSNQSPAFTSANTSFTGFGASSSNVVSPFSSQSTPTTTSVFGTSSTGNSAFATNNPSNNANPSFTFTQPAVQQPQQNSVFAFGGGAATSGNNAPTGSAPFQFGSAAPQIGGFNFTGGPSTLAINFSKDSTSGGSFNSLPAPGTNAFNAPTTGGMFSIGTGSTAPRSRPSRRRQR